MLHCAQCAVLCWIPMLCRCVGDGNAALTTAPCVPAVGCWLPPAWRTTRRRYTRVSVLRLPGGWWCQGPSAWLVMDLAGANQGPSHTFLRSTRAGSWRVVLGAVDSTAERLHGSLGRPSHIWGSQWEPGTRELDLEPVNPPAGALEAMMPAPPRSQHPHQPNDITYLRLHLADVSHATHWHHTHHATRQPPCMPDRGRCQT